MKYRIFIATLLAFVATLLPFSVGTALAKNEGLYISPLRQEVSIVAGQKKTGSFTIANLTEQSMTVDLEVQRFNAMDITYDYTFTDPVNDWVSLPAEQYQLAPGQKQKVTYAITVAADAAAGGYYYALLASTYMATGGVDGTVRVGSLLYTTVDGKGISRSGVIQNAKIPYVVTGTEIPYVYDAENTGNIHTDARFFAKLEGLSGKVSGPTSTQTILPESTRRVDEKLSSPMFPGVYKLTYGYIDESQKYTVQATSYILFVPPWSMVVIVLMIMTGIYFWQRRGRLGSKH